MNRDPFDFFDPAKFIEWQGQTRTASDLAAEIESRIETKTDVGDGRVIPDTFSTHAHPCAHCVIGINCNCSESIRR